MSTFHVSYDICVPLMVSLVFFPGVFLHSRVTGAGPVTTDLILRVNVRTTTFCDGQEGVDLYGRPGGVPGYPRAWYRSVS